MPSSTSASSGIRGRARTAATSLAGDHLERLREVDVADVCERRRDFDLAHGSARRGRSPRGADCRPTMSTRPPRRVAAIAAGGAFGRARRPRSRRRRLHRPSPRAAARRGRRPSRRGRDRLRARVPSRAALRRCRSAISGEIALGRRDRDDEGADPADADHGRRAWPAETPLRRSAWSATASGCAIAAASSVAVVGHAAADRGRRGHELGEARR